MRLKQRDSAVVSLKRKGGGEVARHALRSSTLRGRLRTQPTQPPNRKTMHTSPAPFRFRRVATGVDGTIRPLGTAPVHGAECSESALNSIFTHRPWIIFLFCEPTGCFLPSTNPPSSPPTCSHDLFGVQISSN
ncbi:hypothetical protein MTO96_013107 [Rhipicephalus appendiculatus]